MRTRLSLWFSETYPPELIRTSFSHAGSPLRVAIRGKTSGAYAECGSFQWTGAVQALAVLAVCTRKSELTRETTCVPCLEGGRGTLASSLDYALSKQPQWMADVFGSEINGAPTLVRLVRRTNPNGKRSGQPVGVAFHPNAISGANIAIYWGERELTSAGELTILQHLLEPLNSNFDAEQHHRNVVWKEWLRDALIEEGSSMLVATEIFNRNRLQQNIKQVCAHPSFTSIAGMNASITSTIDWNLSSRNRLGICDESDLNPLRHSETPLRIAVPASAAGSLLILHYMKYKLGINLEINFRFPHAIDIVRHLTRNPRYVPDACIVGIAPAASLLRKRETLQYSPLMLMPNLSHQIIAPRPCPSKRTQLRGEVQLNWGTFGLLCNEPSTASFYLDDLYRNGSISKSRVKATHMEPDEIFQLFRSGDEDARAILFFPYNQLIGRFFKPKILDYPNRLRARECLLFLHHRLLAKSTKAIAFDVAIRRAWLELRANPKLVQSIATTLVYEQDYAFCVERFAGLHTAA